jgi:hypothetical protein
MVADNWPDVRPEHYHREFPARQILLIPDVLIGCNYHVESRLFRSLEKLPFSSCGGQFIFDNRADLVLDQELAHTYWNALVKQDAQRDGSQRMPESPEH